MWLPLVMACADPVVPDPPPPRVDADEVGPYAVGVRTVVLPDPRGETSTVEVWYPAIDPGTAPDPYPELAISRDAHRDADPDTRGAPYPLVAFSHGFGGIRYQSAFLTERLASHGYVVVAPDHRDNTMFDLDSDATGRVLVERPGEVIRAVDGALRDATLAGLADTSRYLMTGHSFGGVTTLIVTGGRLDLAAGAAFCEAHDPTGCGFFAPGELGDATLATSDPRAIAGVDLSPGGYYAFGATGLDDLPPILAIAGDRDEDLPYDDEGRPTMDALPAPKVTVTLADAGHWGVTDLCLIVPFLIDCAGAADGWMEPERVQEVTMTLTTAFAGQRLLGTRRYDAWLLPEAWGGDVTLRAEAR